MKSYKHRLNPFTREWEVIKMMDETTFVTIRRYNTEPECIRFIEWCAEEITEEVI